MSPATVQDISTQNPARRLTYQGRRQMSDRRIAQLFILPTMILLILMNVFPLFYSLYLGFTDYSLISNDPPQCISL